MNTLALPYPQTAQSTVTARADLTIGEEPTKKGEQYLLCHYTDVCTQVYSLYIQNMEKSQWSHPDLNTCIAIVPLALGGKRHVPLGYFKL